MDDAVWQAIREFGLPAGMWVAMLVVLYRVLRGPATRWIDAQVRLTESATKAIADLSPMMNEIREALREQVVETRRLREELLQKNHGDQKT